MTSYSLGDTSSTSEGCSPASSPVTYAVRFPLPALEVLKESVTGSSCSCGNVVPVCFTRSGCGSMRLIENGDPGM